MQKCNFVYYGLIVTPNASKIVTLSEISEFSSVLAVNFLKVLKKRTLEEDRNAHYNVKAPGKFVTRTATFCDFFVKFAKKYG